jgi:hypothetical protein
MTFAQMIGDTTKEYKAEAYNMHAMLVLLEVGISQCCFAEIDTSHVIPHGRYKNHGARVCSKCKRVVYRV